VFNDKLIILYNCRITTPGASVCCCSFERNYNLGISLYNHIVLANIIIIYVFFFNYLEFFELVIIVLNIRKYLARLWTDYVLFKNVVLIFLRAVTLSPSNINVVIKKDISTVINRWHPLKSTKKNHLYSWAKFKFMSLATFIYCISNLYDYRKKYKLQTSRVSENLLIQLGKRYKGQRNVYFYI